MGALNAITNVYANLRTTTGLKRMWVIAIIADFLMLLGFITPLQACLTGKEPLSQLPALLVSMGLLLGKAYVEYFAHRLISELPVVPIKEVEALANLNLLAKIWTVCFLTLSAIIALNVAAAVMVVVAVIGGALLGVFAWFFFQVGFFKFVESLMSPFIGFFKAEGKLLSILHVSPEGALVGGLLLFSGLFIAPFIVALIVIFRRSRLHDGSSAQP